MELRHCCSEEFLDFYGFSNSGDCTHFLSNKVHHLMFANVSSEFAVRHYSPPPIGGPMPPRPMPHAPLHPRPMQRMAIRTLGRTSRPDK